MTEIDAQIHDWMQHSLRLAEVRLTKLPGSRDYSRDFEAALQREVKLIEFVIRYRHLPDLLDGSARVWWEYETAHAHLQIKRYGGRITEEFFRAEARRIRRQRQRQDKALEHVLWLKPERKFA